MKMANLLVMPLVLLAAGNDENAGTWKMIVLTSPDQIPVAAPAPATDAGYLAEVGAVKLAQGRMTEEQRARVDYWNRGGVIRWNELALELVAEYGLPPAPRDDDTYPAPDASNPFADPPFPFSNPPYAARSYSYLSVAQYDALKAAWHYKYLYNRPAPSSVDAGIQSIGGSAGLPAYPSEDAVLAGVSAAMLQALFPAAAEAITRKAADQREAALLSGRATASDIAAGVALGQAVAAIVLGRARTDGMGAAAGNPALWQSLAEAATARGEIAWRSLESPARPPMLPAFGRVLSWMLTAAEVVAERPGPPPPTSSQQMARELAEVRDTVRRLSRAQLAIAYKWADGAGTPAPPGHWNWIAAPYVENAQFSGVRAARAFALLNMAMHDAGVSCWDAKFAYFNPRPSQLDPRIRTPVGMPNFPAYVSGHSTFSAAAAAVLSYLFPEGRARFEADRDEAAISRLYGGIHYRADIEVGVGLGTRVGGYTVRFAQGDGADQ